MEECCEEFKDKVAKRLWVVRKSSQMTTALIRQVERYLVYHLD